MAKTERKDIQINIRMSDEEVAAIDRFIDDGDFDTRTEFIRFAVKKVLKQYSGDRIGFTVDDPSGP